MKLSQKKHLLYYLQEHGSITALEALKIIGSLRLAARIKDLRDEGHNITTENIRINGKMIAKYKLTKQQKR